jgi:hypothetical protein
LIHGSGRRLVATHCWIDRRGGPLNNRVRNPAIFRDDRPDNGDFWGSRCSSRVPRCSSDGPRCSLRGPRCSSDGPRCSLRGPRCSSGRPRCRVEGPRCRLERPRCRSAGPRCRSKGLRRSSDDAGRAVFFKCKTGREGSGSIGAQVSAPLSPRPSLPSPPSPLRSPGALPVARDRIIANEPARGFHTPGSGRAWREGRSRRRGRRLTSRTWRVPNAGASSTPGRAAGVRMT